ncbi:MAG: AEC family transporter [Spirochaetales bacterium]|jgi:predicted permease|nr:AEC family transporter [Spirochaetales bacterium]
MDDLIFSFNVVMPIFLIIGLGYFIKLIGMVDQHFINTINKFNFRVGLSTLLFKNIYNTELTKVFNPRLLIFTIVCITITVFGLWLIIPIFIKDNKKASAMIHTIFRSNFILLGIPLAINMFGESNIAPISFLVSIAIPTYNFFAVTILTVFDKSGYKNKTDRLKFSVINIIKNPLIIASIAGIIVQFFSLKLPSFAENAMSSVASLGTPLALITLGTQLDFRKVVENLKYSIIATLGRLVVVPGIVVILAILVGFRGYELGGIFILFSSPSAISSYIMAQEMNSDYKLTGDIVILTTFFSMFTIFIGIYLLKTFALI